MPHKSVMYHMKTVWARLCTCAISVVLQFWDAAAVWEAFRWDHPDDETPPARTANSLKFLWVTTVHLCGCNSRQEHYANRARGAKATVTIWWFFFTGHQGQSAGQQRPWPSPWNSQPGRDGRKNRFKFHFLIFKLICSNIDKNASFSSMFISRFSPGEGEMFFFNYLVTWCHIRLWKKHKQKVEDGRSQKSGHILDVLLRREKQSWTCRKQFVNSVMHLLRTAKTWLTLLPTWQDTILR